MIVKEMDQKVVSSGSDVNESVENDIANEDGKHKPKAGTQFPQLGVVTKRQGGGTLIESRPIFSHDAK